MFIKHYIFKQQIKEFEKHAHKASEFGEAEQFMYEVRKTCYGGVFNTHITQQLSSVAIQGSEI